MEPTFTDVPGTPGVFCGGVLGLWVAQVEQNLHRDSRGQVAHSGVWLLDLGNGVDPCQNLRGNKSTQHLPRSDCLLPPCPLCPHTCNCLGRREGNMRPGQSQSFTEGVRK